MFALVQRVSMASPLPTVVFLLEAHNNPIDLPPDADPAKDLILLEQPSDRSDEGLLATERKRYVPFAEAIQGFTCRGWDDPKSVQRVLEAKKLGRTAVWRALLATWADRQASLRGVLDAARNGSYRNIYVKAGFCHADSTLTKTLTLSGCPYEIRA